MPDALEQAQTKVTIVVFAMHSCPACQEYLPRFYKQLEGFIALGNPFVIYEPDTIIQPGQIPVIVCDAESQEPSVVALADQHKVTGLPSTILLPMFGFPAKYEGSLTDVQIYQLFMAALATNR